MVKSNIFMVIVDLVCILYFYCIYITAQLSCTGFSASITISLSTLDQMQFIVSRITRNTLDIIICCTDAQEQIIYVSIIMLQCIYIFSQYIAGNYRITGCIWSFNLFKINSITTREEVIFSSCMNCTAGSHTFCIFMVDNIIFTISSIIKLSFETNYTIFTVCNFNSRSFIISRICIFLFNNITT